MKKRIVSSVLLVLIVFSVCFSTTLSYFAETNDEFTSEDAESLENAKDKLEEITQRQKELSSDLKNYSSQKNSEVKAKQTVEQQIEETEEKIDTLNWIIDTLDTRLAEKNEELSKAENEFNEYYRKYTARIRENYEMGTTSYLEIILLSGSFSDMLSRYDYIRDMMDYDKELLEKMSENIRFIQSLKAEIEQDMKEQEESVSMLAEEKKEQNKKIEELNSNIKYISNNIAKLQAEQEEFARLEAELEQQINDLLDKKKKYAGGAFMWPLDSKWSNISSAYGWRTLYGKKEFHYAIDIPADKGTPIYAAADGTIVYYGWTNTGGGNKCVIDHGSKIATHYNHMSAFVDSLKEAFAANGSVDVKKGDVIGYVGTTGNSTGNHLDFKILYDGECLNPSDYVTPDGSTPKKDIMDLLK